MKDKESLLKMISSITLPALYINCILVCVNHYQSFLEKELRYNLSSTFVKLYILIAFKFSAPNPKYDEGSCWMMSFWIFLGALPRWALKTLTQLGSQKLTNFKSIVNSFPLKRRKKSKVHKSNLPDHVYKLQTIDFVEGERGEIYSLILVDWVLLDVSLLHRSYLSSKRHHLHFP